MPKFSVVVPTHDRPTLLLRAVGSILAQAEQDIEVIVVNDGSSVLALPKDTRIRVASSGGKGVAAARNVGILLARGEYITFLDDDDLYSSQRLNVPSVPLSVCMKKVGHRETFYGWRVMRRPSTAQVTIERGKCPMFDEGFARTEDVDWWLTVTANLRPVEVPFVGLLVTEDDPNHLRKSLSNEVRLECVLRLLSKHPTYFSANRAAAAYNWTRAARLAPDRHTRFAFLWRAFKLWPRPSTLVRLPREALRNLASPKSVRSG